MRPRTDLDTLEAMESGPSMEGDLEFHVKLREQFR